MSHQATIQEEITTLRRLVRSTRRGIRLGTIDPLKGGRLIANTTALLSRLVRLQHKLNLTADRQADEKQILSQILKAARTMIYAQNTIQSQTQPSNHPK